jgi:hypothetical protein
MTDLKFVARQLLKHPGFTAVAVVTLALGIGANTAMFRVINRVLLSPLPFPEARQPVMVRSPELANGLTDGSVAGPDFLDWRAASPSFTGLAAAQFGRRFSLTGRGEPVTLAGAYVTPDFFDVFALPIHLGRAFHPAAALPGQEDRVLLSYGAWRGRFGHTLRDLAPCPQGRSVHSSRSLSVDGRMQLFPRALGSGANPAMAARL